MISKAAIVVALAFSVSLSTATAPCKWFHGEGDGGEDTHGGLPVVALSRCMGAVEHVWMSSVKCRTLAERNGNWTEEQCDSIVLNQYGDGGRCESLTNMNGTRCMTPEAKKVIDTPEFIAMWSGLLECGAIKEKKSCNDDDKCRWVGGVGCSGKQYATEVAFCRQFAEGHCGGSMPPKFEDLSAEGMSIFDNPLEEAEVEDKFSWSGYLGDQDDQDVDDQGEDDQDGQDDQGEDDQDESADLTKGQLKDILRELEDLKGDASAAPRVAVSGIAVFIAAVVFNL